MNASRMKDTFYVFILMFLSKTAVAQTPAIPLSIADFPNSPEGAYKALLFAMGAGDETSIRAVTISTPGLNRLLETNRIPKEKLATLHEQLLKGNDVIRLKAGDTVRMAGGDVYAVRVGDIAEGRAVLKDGVAGALPIRCRVEEGRWRVDARLIIANRRVAGVESGEKSKGRAHRDIVMPIPLTGPAYPNTPEGAYRTFLVAYLTADAPNLQAVCLPTDGFEWLLRRPPCSFEQAAKYQADLDRRTFRTLKPGDAFDVGGRKVTITAKEITPTRTVVASDLPGLLPVPCELIDGKWWVDSRPMIISLKAEASSKSKTATTKP